MLEQEFVGFFPYVSSIYKKSPVPLAWLVNMDSLLHGE